MREAAEVLVKTGREAAEERVERALRGAVGVGPDSVHRAVLLQPSPRCSPERHSAAVVDGPREGVDS